MSEPAPSAEPASAPSEPASAPSEPGPDSAARTRWRPSVAILAVGTFAVGTDAFVIAGVLPSLAESLAVGVGAAGQLVTVFALAYALTAPFVGALTAGWSRRTTLLVAMAVFALGNAVTALAPGYAYVLASRVVAAAGAALYTATASATAARLAGPERRGRAIAIVMFGLTSSLVLGTPLGTLIGTVANWRATLWFVTVLGLAAALAIALRLPALPGRLSPGRGAEGERSPGTLSLLAQPLRDPRVLRLLLSTFLVFLGIYTPYTYISAVYQPSTGGDGGALAVLLLLFGVAGTLGNLVAGSLSDRIGPARVIVTATVLLAAVFAALPLVRTTFWLAVPAVVVSGALSFSVTTPQQHQMLSYLRAPGSIGTSLYQGALYLAISASGVAGALALRWTGADWLGPISAAFVLLAAALTAYRGREK